MEFFGFIVYITLCFAVYAVANSKGRSGCGWFFLSLLISPLIAIIIVAIIGETEEKRRETLQSDIETTEDIKKKMSETASVAQNTFSVKDGAIAELKRSKHLLDLGVISQDEYDAKKDELLPILMGKTEQMPSTVQKSDENKSNPNIYDVYRYKTV